MLLTWYSYSSGIWSWLGKVSMWSFRHILEKFRWAPSVFYILLLSVLFIGWMFVMNKYYSNHKDKGLID